jgi:streptogramin lyase
MPTRRFAVVASLAALLVVLAAAITSLADGMMLSEASLTTGGKPYEVNTDATGNLFISDYNAGEIWQLQPTTSAYTKYRGLPNASDARPDGMGNIWWTDWRTTTGRINALAETVTTWTIEGSQLGGLALDGDGRVWIATRSSSPVGAAVYRLDPQTAELCGYEWQGGSNSEYVLYSDGHVWLADRAGPRIVRFDPAAAQDQVKWWSLAPGALPRGLALDAAGHPWWTDLGADALASLDPGNDQITTYSLPLGSYPEMLVVDDVRAWYTTVPGSVGALDPALASGTVATAATGSLTTSASCHSMGTGTTTTVFSDEGTLAWATPTELAPVLDGDGWTIYQLSANLYGIARSSGSLWVADSGRQKLVRLDPPDYGILGDVNGDRVANSTDALIVLSADAGLDASQFCPVNCGDVNADGLVNSTDALIILSYDAGLTVPFPVGLPGCSSSVAQPPGCNP